MVTALRLKKYTTNVNSGNHNILADVPAQMQGLDLGMTPHAMLEGALAACTSITIQMYADRKNIPLESADVEVKITEETSQKTVFTRNITLHGNLTDEQKQMLMQVADKCPVHKILSKPSEIV